MSEAIAITSGKGGVGKTTISVNLSIAFKKLDNHTLLLDTDMGMANSHVLLGVNPEYTLENILKNEKTISEVIIKTSSGVELVSGGFASTELLNLTNDKRYIVLNEIENYLLKYEKAKLIVDIAAGAEDNSVVFAKACGRIVVVIVGEPTSFVDSYALIKTISQKSEFQNFCILVNQVDSKNMGMELFKRFEAITSKFLDVKLNYVGCVNYSPKIKKSIIDRSPLLISDPKSDISMNFLKIAQEIIKTPKNVWGGLSFFNEHKKRA